MANVIYLDNAATTKVDPEVLNSYNQITLKYFANPSSIHSLGQESSRLLDKSREQILNVLKLTHHDVIFTSGATEANNLAIKGYCFANRNRGKHIITSATEHPSVLNTVLEMQDFGFEVTVLPVNKEGQIEVNSLKAAIREDTILVSLMMVNNEVGAINPIKEVGEYLKKFPKIAFHVDMVQAIGKLPLDFNNIDMFSIAGHKIHGLLGSGLLIKEKKIILKASVVVEALSNRGIMVSSLSACHAKNEDYSKVVYAMYQDLNLAHNTIRISFDKDNTLEEVEALIKNLEEILKEIKQ